MEIGEKGEKIRKSYIENCDETIALASQFKDRLEKADTGEELVAICQEMVATKKAVE